MRTITFLCVLAVGIIAVTAGAADWPMFRGPGVDGMTSEPETPTTWSDTENIAWSSPLPRPGNGSPIVVGRQVLICSAEDDRGHGRSLLCFDAANGKQQWKQTVTIDQTLPTHKTNPYGSSTPASDGQRVVVWHGSAGLHAYDMAGKPLWSRDLGTFRHMWGYGTSPIIIGDRVILHTGPGKQVFVLAFDLETGEELWRHEEPVAGDGERNEQKKYMGSWCTPVPTQVDGRTLAVCAMATRVCGFDVQTGEPVWYCQGVAGDRGDLAYASPMIEGDLCVVLAGFQGPSLAFRMQGSGDITDASRLWRNERQNPQTIGTGLLLGGYLYRIGAGPNMIDCLDAKTGETIWKDRAEGGAYWGSISYNGQLAYATDQSGTTLVFRPSPKGLEKISANPLRDHCNATPALADGRIYIRTADKLWCIAKP